MVRISDSKVERKCGMQSGWEFLGRLIFAGEEQWRHVGRLGRAGVLVLVVIVAREGGTGGGGVDAAVEVAIVIKCYRTLFQAQDVLLQLMW